MKANKHKRNNNACTHTTSSLIVLKPPPTQYKLPPSIGGQADGPNRSRHFAGKHGSKRI